MLLVRLLWDPLPDMLRLLDDGDFLGCVIWLPR
jgi:hypothetical protein